MKRIIKFRVWDKERKKMFLGIPKDFVNDLPQRADAPNSFYGTMDVYFVCLNTKVKKGYRDIWELMQFTGLKDKNGKEIYEGDILNLGDNYNSIVEWSDYMEGPCFALHEVYPKGEEDRWHSMEAYTTPKEVIGNIYENPELLKEANEKK